MELKVDTETLKSPFGIVAAIVIVAVAFGWMHMRRAALVKDGTAEVVEHLQMELPAQYMRDHNGIPDPERLQQLGQVEVLDFSPSWFFRADRDDEVTVKTVIRTGTGETGTYYFRFKSVLGSWKLQREAHKPLLDAF